MRMMIAALLGAVVLAFVDVNFLQSPISHSVTDPSMQSILLGGVAAFLGGIWGWLAKGMLGAKPKD